MTPDNTQSETHYAMITGKQIRAARGALNWSVRQLAERSGVGAATITRYETVEGVPLSRKGNLRKLRRALENHGIRFVSDRRNSFGLLFDRSTSGT